MDKRLVRRSLFAALMGVFGVTGTAFAVTEEVEPNDLRDTAQALSVAPDLSVVTIGAQIDGEVVSTPMPNRPSLLLPDVDFYSFYAPANGELRIELLPSEPFHGVLTVVGPNGTVSPDGRPVWEIKGEMAPEVEGDVVSLDIPLTHEGIWAVVVTPVGVLIADPSAPSLFDGLVTGQVGSANGAYTVVITPAMSPAPPAPQVKQVGLTIKPGESERAPINPKAKGKIPVALLGSQDFDPFNIDLASLRFGATGSEESFERCAGGGGDVNADGYRDRVCLFENQAAGFTYTSTMGYIKGMTTDGVAFEGQGILKAVPMPKGKAKGKKN